MNPADVRDLAPDLGGAVWPAPVDGRVVMVTGAAGSIGQAVARRCLDAGAARVVLADVDENGLYLASRRLERAGLADRAAIEIANIREGSRMRTLISRHRPSLILHAAAHKHVPLLQRAPCEAVRNNVLATADLCAAAVESSAQFVLVSTDKAVAPVSVLGATKRIAEWITLAASPTFAVARTGNVLGSSGSVVPLFLEQIAAGGPVTLTDRRATRFFTRLEDAGALVLAAAAEDHGPLLISDPGAALSIRRIAEILIAGRSIAIEEVGLRPGEKLHEALMSDAETAQAEALGPHLWRVPRTAVERPAGFDAAIVALGRAAARESDRDVLALLGECVPDYASTDAANGRPSARS